MDIAILGAGPAGLLAAHAVANAGHSPVIFSRPEPSVLSGSQWLQATIPDLRGLVPSGKILFVHLGSADIYAAKGGGDPRELTSWQEKAADRHYEAWSLRDAYSVLWKWYSECLFATEVDENLVSDLVRERAYPLVISSIPPLAYCQHRARHWFQWYAQWIDEQWPIDWPEPTEDCVVYSGYSTHDWIRASQIFGHRSTEWPADIRDVPGRSLRKPLRTNCNCFVSEGIVRVGRYGCWDNNVLVHHAYAAADEALLSLKLGRAS